ncbi:chemotaxis protein CheX [Borrelia persica]|uniref:chemotaxis protein CheX n=1 Tax=Borrelia persica TaxID=44448 RepID=UPI000463E597|nr:chemotaxis protein CheX [Borrelia persica]
MRIDYIEPFLDAASSVLRDMLYIDDIQMGTPGLHVRDKTIKGVSVIVGLAGSVEGSIVIDMDLDTALFVTSKLNFTEFVNFNDDETRDMVTATLTELGNVIAGHFVTTLHYKGFVFDITPPAFIYGENMNILNNCGAEALIVPFTLPGNKIIEVNIAIRERV